VRILTSAKVQANFGAAADIAKSGEVVTITQYGRPALMLFSYKDGEALLRLRAAAELNGYFEGRTKTMPQGEPELSMDDIDKLVHELRA
jgi:hypothetical protein